MLPAYSKQSGLEDIIGKLHNREKRRSNIVKSGLIQSSVATDKELTEVILTELKVTSTITHYHHLKTKSNQSSPLLVTLSSSSDCTNIIKVVKNLRSTSNLSLKNVFINPDLTPLQREDQKRLIIECKTWKTNGENVMISRGRVILRADRP